MKTFSSKVLLFMLLTAVGFGFSSCSDDEPGKSTSNPLVGTWRVYNTDASGKTAAEWWYRFSKDGTTESLGYDQSEKCYLYSSGPYELADDWITVDFKQQRIYKMYNQLLRCMAEFKDEQAVEERVKIQILDKGDDECRVVSQGNIFWLVKEEFPSDKTYAECSEPEVRATKKILAGQWDMRSYFALNGKQYQGWCPDKPEEYGMTLVEDGSFAYMQFWINDLVMVERQAGRIGQNDGIYVYYKDCAWGTSGEVVDFVCTLYERVQYDGSGNEIARDTIKPLVPILVTYPIHFLSENWLTLYAPHENLYFSFHRNNKAAAAPSHAPAGSPIPVRRIEIP